MIVIACGSADMCSCVSSFTKYFAVRSNCIGMYTKDFTLLHLLLSSYLNSFSINFASPQ